MGLIEIHIPSALENNTHIKYITQEFIELYNKKSSQKAKIKINIK